MTRRGLLASLALLVGGKSAEAAAKAGDPQWQLSDAQWKQRLSPAYQVLRQEGTERPFSSPLNNEKRRDLSLRRLRPAAVQGQVRQRHRLAQLRTPANAIGTSVDFKLIVPRTEYHCQRCGGHQGHVFNDGPRSTGKRYCNNGVALTFKPETT